MMVPMPVGKQRVLRVDKRWGREHWIENNEKYCAKLLMVTPPLQCSLHYHLTKDETFWVLAGECILEFGKRVRHMVPGNFQRIRPGTPHRFTVPDRWTGEVCLIAEISTHHDDADVVRLEKSGICKLSKAELMRKGRNITRISQSGSTKKTASRSSASGTHGSSRRGR